MARVELPPPDELRRRIRAARAYAGIDDIDDLAQLVHPTSRLSARTLRKLETGESDPTAPQLRELASALGVAFEWFTHPDLGRAPAQADPSVGDRIALLEARMRQWEQFADRWDEVVRAAALVHDLGHVPAAPETLRAAPPKNRR
jgi:transcriptional regulator with XRE-family HTH domain